MARMLAPLFVVLLLLAQSISAGPARAHGTWVIVEANLAIGTEFVVTGRPAGLTPNAGGVPGNCNGEVFNGGVHSVVVTGATSGGGLGNGSVLSNWQSDPGAGARFTIIDQLGFCSSHGHLYEVQAQ